ncbi:MAG TPA: hypothetical protein VGA68_05215 [Woeseiaceae bacterium]
MRFGLLVLLISGFLLGSCSSDKLSAADVITAGFADLRFTANSAVGDSVRRDKYLKASLALEAELRSFDEYFAGAVGTFRTAFADYDAGQDSLRRISDEYFARQKDARTRFVDAHAAMAASVTVDEWKVLSRKEISLLKDIRSASVRSLQ